MNKREIIGTVASVFVIIVLLYVVIILSIWVIVARLVFGYKKIVINGENNYVFIENNDVAFITNRIKDVIFSNDWLQIIPNEDGSSTIIVRATNPKKKGYAWDGCSPKFQILDLIIGTPDGIISHQTGKPLAYYASMVHDILYQFRKGYDKKVLRKEVDRIFLDELRKENFQMAFVYYAMVRVFGWAYWNS